MLLNFLSPKSLFVAGLRGLTLLAKLAFMVLLARWLSAEEFGQWVLVFAIVTYGIFIVGAELYNVSLRRYVAEGHEAVIPAFSAQWFYFAASYAVMVAVGLVLSYLGGSALFANALVISGILIFEHFSHELHRLAFYGGHQIHANMILVIKTAGWMIPTGAYLAFHPASASLSLVLWAWLAGAALAAVYALAFYRRIFRGLRFHYVRSVFGKLDRGFRLVAPFLVIALAMRTPFLIDRYMIEHFAGTAAVGPYGYYATFGNGVQALFDVVILARLIPRLLGEKHTHAEHVKIVFSYAYQTLAFWILSLAALYVAIPYVNRFVGKESFQEAFGLFIVLSVGQMIFALASVMHYGLYALHRDRQLATGALVYLGLTVVLYVALIPSWGSYGAAIALALATLGFLCLRTLQLLRDDPPASPAVSDTAGA